MEKKNRDINQNIIVIHRHVFLCHFWLFRPISPYACFLNMMIFPHLLVRDRTPRKTQKNTHNEEGLFIFKLLYQALKIADCNLKHE
jgi:hypothetical protein